ncbi:MAG: fused MFS/spermidine synthase [Anaerolineae bacterium]|nr:fused MFS/spermidine synthase [Anaerolineae bacterium]MDW8069014.1 fused MFS/spermidine synthase [Anaerolineae bacterium]
MLAILAMGFSGLVAEVFLLREFLIVFAGNEFSIGLILANWLVLEALGAWAFGRIAERFQRKTETFTVITALFFGFLLLALFLIRLLKRILGISVGEPVGLVPMFGSSLVILAPVSLLHGALFPASCQLYAAFSGQSAPSTGWVYACETIGTVLGGIFCTYLLIPYFHTFQAVFWVALANLLVCAALLASAGRTERRSRTLLVITGALAAFWGLGGLAGLADVLHHLSIQVQWKGLHVVHYQNSPYGNFCVVENEGQYIFFQDGIPELITPVPDLPFVEEFVHFPLLAHPEPRRLLILSGGAGGVLHEALQHPAVETIEYAELDPLLMELLRRFPTPLTESELNDRRTTILHRDGRMYLRMARHTYDVILVGLTEPSTLQTNRFFTQEFFRLAQRKLTPGGILVLGLPGSLTYSTPELADLNSSIFHTLKSVFRYIRVIPGEGTHLFLASDSPDLLRLDREQVIERLHQRRLRAERIMPWYIEQKLHPGWQDWFHRFIAGSSREVNEDFRPIGVFYSVSHWNALFAPSLRGLFRQLERINLGMVALLCSGMFLGYLLSRLKRRPPLRTEVLFAIATTGFAGMIFDLMLIFAFQSVYGYVFSWIGLLVALFMAGAACGALLVSRALKRIRNGFRWFLKTELAVMGFAVVCPLLLQTAPSFWEEANGWLFQGAFLTLSFVSGFLISVQFPLANWLLAGDKGHWVPTAGLLYAADLLGGWLGGMGGAVVLLPILGLWGTGITVFLFKLTSLTVWMSQVGFRWRGGGT